MNIELESKINLLNLKPGLLFFMYLCNIELSYDLSLQIFKYLDSIDVDDSDVKAGYSIHLVSIISYSQLQFPHWFTCIYLFNFKNLAELLWEPILWRHKAYKDLFLCWWWNNHNKSLQRHIPDRDGYDLVFVDAMHKANYASRICHSCNPNCEAK